MTDKEFIRLKHFIQNHKDHIASWYFRIKEYDHKSYNLHVVKKIDCSQKSDFGKIVKNNNVYGIHYKNVRHFTLEVRNYTNKQGELKLFVF